MAEDRFDRFRKLERPRRPGIADARDPSPGTEERFEALEERKPTDAVAGSPGAGPVAEGHLDRFRPAAERPIEIAPEAEGELPFIRCASCQMDHNRTALACTNCGADLRTEGQRAFNAALAVERRSQAAVEKAQVAELERAQAEAREEGAASQRAMGEALAREVGEAERRRLEAEGIGGDGWRTGDDGPGLMGLVRMLLRTRWR